MGEITLAVRTVLLELQGFPAPTAAAHNPLNEEVAAVVPPPNRTEEGKYHERHGTYNMVLPKDFCTY
jgi:hypothetical protein